VQSAEWRDRERQRQREKERGAVECGGRKEEGGGTGGQLLCQVREALLITALVANIRVCGLTDTDTEREGERERERERL